ncbi:MAG: 3-isopropylmalate dehydrogenase [Xanthomonadales bacterium]|nr:3-isopropylmalate dehydrogenase [Xanthomonadales bacterium]
MSIHIVLLPGDGIGPEVTAEAELLIGSAAEKYGLDVKMESALIGGAAIDATGDPLPHETLAACREADAVVLGAVGGPRWSDPNAAVRPEQGLLKIRKELGLYANLRPVRLHPSLLDASPLKPERLEGVDLMVVRELTGGSYFGEKQEGDEFAMDLCSYSRVEVERVVRRAGGIARARRGKLTMIDKANVMATSRLWRKVTTQVMASEFPDVELEFMLVDAAAMFLVSHPARFDVIVTENMFGDILTDEASVLAGSMGMLPSASLGAGRTGLYEPIHGSAPDIAGKGLANPFGTLASVAMLFEYSLDMKEVADGIENAIRDCISDGECTIDLGGVLTTAQAGAAVRKRLPETGLSRAANG